MCALILMPGDHAEQNLLQQCWERRRDHVVLCSSQIGGVWSCRDRGAAMTLNI